MSKMLELISVPIYVEERNETINLKLLPRDAARVTRDANYMRQLVMDYYEKNKDFEKQWNMEISNNGNNANDEMIDVIDPLFTSNACNTLFLETEECDNNPKNIVNEKSLFIWPSKCVYLLLDKYEEQKEEFTGGMKRHNKIWDAIADDIRKVNMEYTMNGLQCQSKFNSLKKTYKKILDYNSVSGNDRKTWPYFERMHEIFGKSGWANPKAIASEAGPCEETTSSGSGRSDYEDKKKHKKQKFENVLDNFMLDMKEERVQREKRRETKDTWFQELKQQRENQHKEKMEMMQKLLEAIKK